MFILLPIISFCLFWMVCFRYLPRPVSIRESFLLSCLLTGSLIAIQSETLSLFSSFTRGPLITIWIFIIVTTVLWLFLGQRKNLSRTIESESPTSNSQNSASGDSETMDTTKQKWLTSSLLIAIAVIIILTGLTAFVAPPNNWDSMTYHMSRVAHWIQNQTVAFYPTSMPRQLWASPWAEYAIAHLQLLSLSDRWANLVQWFCMLGSVIGCSLIAKSLGANWRTQIITAAICVSLPVGILEASSTQNDYAAAFWCVCAVYFGLQYIQRQRHTHLIALAASLALAFLTKTSTFVFLFPFLILFSIHLIRSHFINSTMAAFPRKRELTYVKIPAFAGMTKMKESISEITSSSSSKKLLLPLVLIIGMIFLINGPQIARNCLLSGNPFSLSSESKTVTSQTLSLTGTFSTALRYLGLNLCTPNESINQQIRNTIAKIHEILHLNLIDPRFTHGEKYEIKQDIHEDNTCNSAFTVLFIFISLLFFFRRTVKLSQETMLYFLSIWAGIFLFCLLLKWQPWGNRLLLPLYVLSTPLVGVMLGKHFPRAQTLFAIALILLCIPWITSNRSRPLISKDFTIFNKPRNEQYFSNIPGEFYSYDRAAQEILQSDCRDIALVMTSESWEYPLWPLLNAPRNKPLRIEHVNVSNPSNKYDYPLGPFNPCLAIHDTAKGIAQISINGTSFIKTNQYTYLSIYRKDTDGTLARTVRNSNFQQLVLLSLESDQVLKNAQLSGRMDQNAFMESFRLRKLSVDYAEMLNSEELNQMVPNLGTLVNEVYIKGSNLLLNGLSSQDSNQLNEGQHLLNQWNAWLMENLKELQRIFN